VRSEGIATPDLANSAFCWLAGFRSTSGKPCKRVVKPRKPVGCSWPCSAAAQTRCRSGDRAPMGAGPAPARPTKNWRPHSGGAHFLERRRCRCRAGCFALAGVSTADPAVHQNRRGGNRSGVVSNDMSADWLRSLATSAILCCRFREAGACGRKSFTRSEARKKQPARCLGPRWKETHKLRARNGRRTGSRASACPRRKSWPGHDSASTATRSLIYEEVGAPASDGKSLA